MSTYTFTYNSLYRPTIAQKATLQARAYTEAVIWLRKEYNAYNITLVKQ